LLLSAPVFISHSSIDRKVAETICDAVQARGYQCWISSRDIGPGENFQEAIVKAIGAAKLMILVFTANANNSHEIKKELALAGQHQLVVIPVRVENVLPSGAFAYELATRQWIDLFDGWERRIAQLTEKIDTILSQAGAGAAVAQAAPNPIAAKPIHAARKRLVPALFALLLVVALGAGGAALYYRVGAPTPAVPQPTSGPAAGRFDGLWNTTMDCPKFGTVLAINLQFVTRVAGGHLHGQRGAEGTPSSLTLDGDIAPDGSVTVAVKGFTGDSAYSPNNLPSGVPIRYEFLLHLEDTRGSASIHLPLGRPCEFTFVKQ
jgi:TIR domain